MSKSRIISVVLMIYSGYENGHFFVRLTHDIPVLDAMDVLGSGYKLVMGYMLLLKRRELAQSEVRSDYLW